MVSISHNNIITSDDFAVMMSLYLAMAVSDELWSSSKDVSNKPSKPLPPFPLTGNANGPSCQSVPSVRVTPKSKKCHEHKGQTSLEVSYMATSGFGNHTNPCSPVPVIFTRSTS